MIFNHFVNSYQVYLHLSPSKRDEASPKCRASSQPPPLTLLFLHPSRSALNLQKTPQANGKDRNQQRHQQPGQLKFPAADFCDCILLPGAGWQQPSGFRTLSCGTGHAQHGIQRRKQTAKTKTADREVGVQNVWKRCIWKPGADFWSNFVK